MRSNSAAVAFAAVLAAGVGGGYLAGEAANPQPASAQSPAARTQTPDGSMGAAGGSMLRSTVNAPCTRMMGDPAMRRLKRPMLRDPAMRREMRTFPAMAAMMGDQMGG